MSKRINSRAKGVKNEKAATYFLRGLGFTDARRTAQHRGNHNAADIECPESLPRVHFEVKCDQSIDFGPTLDAVCERAAKDAGHDRWCVLWRHNRTCWKLTTNSRAGPCRAQAPVFATTHRDTDVAAVLRWINDREPEPPSHPAVRP